MKQTIVETFVLLALLGLLCFDGGRSAEEEIEVSGGLHRNDLFNEWGRFYDGVQPEYQRLHI